MAVEISFPEHFRGIYARTEEQYGHLIREAVAQVESWDVGQDLRPFLAYQLFENPQPSFILFPFMYLATADAAGGVTEGHRNYLPAIMLMAELCAVADDTIDRAPLRSGRETFVARFGDASALPMACALAALVMREAQQSARLQRATTDFYTSFFGLELWERAHLYPEPELFEEWLDHRNEQAIVATEYVLNCALFFRDARPWPREAVAAFARIGQVVDDVVNVLEYRELEGENDDLQGGIVTLPLIRAIERVPSLGPAVSALWTHYRELASRDLPIAQLARERARLNEALLPRYAKVREQIIEHGVPAAVRECLTELQTAVLASPPELRPLMQDLASAFLDRLRSCRHILLETERKPELVG